MDETKASNLDKEPSPDHMNELLEPETRDEVNLSTQHVDTQPQVEEKVSLGGQVGAEFKPIPNGFSSPRGAEIAEIQPPKELQTADQTDRAVSEPRHEISPPVDSGRVSPRPVEEPASVKEDAIIKIEPNLNIPLPPTKSAAVDESQQNSLLSEMIIDEKRISIELAQEPQSTMRLHEQQLDLVSVSGQEVNASIPSKATPLKVEPEPSSTFSPTENSNDPIMGTLPKKETEQDLVPAFNEGCREQETDNERLSRTDDSGTGVPTEEDNMGMNAEFELDSSPIESFSPDTSTDSSSSEDSDQDDYVMLEPAEQARRLMQEEGGSDDEGGGKAGNAAGSGPLRTLNEKPDEVVPKPDLTITPAMKISELGKVENLVENLVLVKGKTSGEYQVLEFGSVLCLEDRSVIGVIAETLGRVQQPFYSVRFTNATAISEAGISQGTKIFYVDQFSTSVFTQTLKAFKGSDASNLHDEEAGDAEIEFSDDEAEAEHKKRLKLKKQSRRDGRQDHDGFSKGVQQNRSKHQRTANGRPPEHNNAAITKSEPKDEDNDDLYTPLARPPNLHEIMGQREAPIETRVTYHKADRGFRGDRARGGRVRGDRGRGRGERGRGDQGSRGGFENRSRNGNEHRNRSSRIGPGHRNGDDRKNDSSSTNDLSQRFGNNTFHSPPAPPPPTPPDVGFRPYSAVQNSPLAPTATSSFQPYPPPFAHQNHPNQQHDPYSQIYPPPQYHPPQSYPPPNYQQPSSQHPYPNHHQQQPSNAPYASYQPQFQPPPSNIPPGAHVNPAFFAPPPPQHPASYPSPQPFYRSGLQQIGRGVGGSNSSPQAIGHSPGSDAAFRAAQERLDVLRNLNHQGPGSS